MERASWLFFAVLSVLVNGALAQEKIVDNGDEGFSQEGFVVELDSESHDSDLAIASRPTEKHRARFAPGLTGVYDVYLYWRDFADKASDVLWTAHHADGVTTHSFSQRNNPGWHFHGTYQLDASSHLSLDGRNRQDAAIVADAVKFVPAVKRVVQRVAKDTITPMTLNYGDELHFQLRKGETRKSISRSLRMIGRRALTALRPGSPTTSPKNKILSMIVCFCVKISPRAVPYLSHASSIAKLQLCSFVPHCCNIGSSFVHDAFAKRSCFGCSET